MFQSTLPAKGATTALNGLECTVFQVSIHAPREGSDSDDAVSRWYNVSIHAPREGTTIRSNRLSETFQSTLPAKGATGDFSLRPAHGMFQSTLPRRERLSVAPGLMPLRVSIHAPRGGSDALCAFGTDNTVSIHAPREGSDLCRSSERRYRVSIHAPAKGATRALDSSKPERVSIHAPREGSDAMSGPIRTTAFQSTLPAEGATPPRS